MTGVSSLVLTMYVWDAFTEARIAAAGEIRCRSFRAEDVSYTFAFCVYLDLFCAVVQLQMSCSSLREKGNLHSLRAFWATQKTFGATSETSLMTVAPSEE